ncbi:MAG: DUF2071 domain-containing protein [Planctomycetia bacterium]|nr:DUF2071 domain-containing protein [Planctomycetia bacterium]
MPRPDIARPFMRAAWRRLAMASFSVDPRVLRPLVPAGTLLDEHEGQALVTVVGFWFQRAKLFGVRIPWHQHFSEVNLRFYVRREVAGQWRPGVVFIRELVPRRMVAWTARLYGERFTRVALSCHHNIPEDDNTPGPRRIEYAWGRGANAAKFSLNTNADAGCARAQGEASFVVDRSWAYTARRDGSTWEYQVARPPWRIWPAIEVELCGAMRAWYGPALGDALAGPATSAFLVDGSDVAVYPGHRIWSSAGRNV